MFQFLPTVFCPSNEYLFIGIHNNILFSPSPPPKKNQSSFSVFRLVNLGLDCVPFKFVWLHFTRFIAFLFQFHVVILYYHNLCNSYFYFLIFMDVNWEHRTAEQETISQPSTILNHFPIQNIWLTLKFFRNIRRIKTKSMPLFCNHPMMRDCIT